MEQHKIGKLVVDKFISKNKKYNYPLVLVHGANGGSWYLEKYANYFCEAGWDSYVPNLRGHKPSDPEKNINKVSYYDYVEDIMTVIKALKLENVALIGHSLGGIIVQKVAEQTQGTKALVVIAGGPPKGVKFIFPKHPGMPSKFIMVLKGILDFIRNKPLMADYNIARITVLNNFAEEEAKEVYQKLVPDSLKSAMQVGKCIPIDKSKMTFPKLVIGFGDDAVMLPELERNIATYYQADYLEFEKLAHFGMIEKGWERSAEGIKNWLIKNK